MVTDVRPQVTRILLWQALAKLLCGERSDETHGILVPVLAVCNVCVLNSEF